MPTQMQQSSRAESFEPVATKSRVQNSWSSYPKETYIAALSAACILLSLTLRYIVQWRSGWEIPLYIAVVAGGVPLVIDLGRKLLAREFGSDLLAGLSVITSVLLGQYLVGAIVVLMLSGGAALEYYATRRASAVLEALARRMPTNAHRKTHSGITDIALADIVIGETLVVLPNEICPVDGVVVSGRGAMDESYLTGEPFQISKSRVQKYYRAPLTEKPQLPLPRPPLPSIPATPKSCRSCAHLSRAARICVVSPTGSARGTRCWRWRSR